MYIINEIQIFIKKYEEIEKKNAETLRAAIIMLTTT
jgi:hypothetical protein